MEHLTFFRWETKLAHTVSSGISDRRKDSLVKKTLLVLSAISFLLTANSIAQAQVTIDVSKITCDEFVKYEIADPKQIAAWISGYNHGIHNNPIVDQQKVLQTTNKVEQYCFEHPDALVMKAVDELLGGGEGR